MLRGERVRLKCLIEPLEIVNVKQSDTLCSDDVLILKERFIIGQGEHVFCQSNIIAFFRVKK